MFYNRFICKVLTYQALNQKSIKKPHAQLFTLKMIIYSFNGSDIFNNRNNQYQFQETNYFNFIVSALTTLPQHSGYGFVKSGSSDKKIVSQLKFPMHTFRYEH